MAQRPLRPADVPETFTIPSLPALPEALQTARVHTAAGLEGDAPVAMPGDAESTPLSRLGDAMHQLLEQAGVAGAPLADVRAHGWPAARLARLAADHDITPAAAEQAARMAQAILAGEGAWAWDAALIQTARATKPRCTTRARACASTGWCSRSAAARPA
jgi:ATP-dependent helicase/nuclease subunit A